jgi:hypothetical protein
MFRKGFYQLISGHTTTGFMTIYAKQFYYEWGDIALFAITIAMMFGGSASSTAGGFKGMRTGISLYRPQERRASYGFAGVACAGAEIPPHSRYCSNGHHRKKCGSDCRTLCRNIFIGYARRFARAGFP